MPNSQPETFRGDGSERGTFRAREEPDDEVEAELEALFALAQVHAEVAVAYEIVAQDVGARSVRDKLLEFARDHRRQLKEIGAYLKAQSVEPAAPMPPAESSAIVTLADALSAMAPEVGLQALSASTQFTCASYAALLEVTADSPLKSLVGNNLAVQRRHARWLEAHLDDDLRSNEASEQ